MRSSDNAFSEGKAIRKELAFQKPQPMAASLVAGVFTLNFDAHFGRSQKIAMNENFRCGQRIIDCAEIMVRDPADSIFAKHGISAGKAKEFFGEVSLMKGEDDGEIIQLVKMLRAQEKDAIISSRFTKMLI